jgi:hypothetical protein
MFVQAARKSEKIERREHWKLNRRIFLWWGVYWCPHTLLERSTDDCSILDEGLG